MDFGVEILGLLFLVGVIAGFVDAIAGGGGLLALPALMFAGVPASHALGTLKFQGTAGAVSASVNFILKGQVKFRLILQTMIFAFAGSMIGARVTQFIHGEVLEKIIPFLLIAIALYLAFGPKPREISHQPKLSWGIFALLFGIGLGFYDGFFGPGVGTFWAIAFVSLMGMTFKDATAQTKVVNATSNIAALITFIIGGKIIWPVAVCMAVGQGMGSYAGAHVVVKNGTKIIRPMLIVVSLCISARLLYKAYFS